MVQACEVPPGSLLGRYASSGAFTDCYVTAVPTSVTHAQYVEAFYTTRLFKVERYLLGVFISRPSTDDDARQLAAGQSSAFAAWSVEARAESQLMLAAGRTRSWLMVAPAGEAGQGGGTQLFFGSAVVPPRGPSGEPGGMGWLFGLLLGFHKLYSRALLSAARARLLRR